jgi:hydrogenase maturation factor
MRTSACSPEHACITCSDEGIPMRVVEPDAGDGLALCQDPDGARHAVEVALVGPVRAGDAVLVHAAVALTRLGEAA